MHGQTTVLPQRQLLPCRLVWNTHSRDTGHLDPLCSNQVSSTAAKHSYRRFPTKLESVGTHARVWHHACHSISTSTAAHDHVPGKPHLFGTL